MATFRSVVNSCSIRADVIPGVTVDAEMFGGPFRGYRPDRRIVSVKMACEIDAVCDINIPTVDFGTPPQQCMTDGLCAAWDALLSGNDLYVGCMGGIGRTGLFMAVMLRVAAVLNGRSDADAIMQVRTEYNYHAVETLEQMEYVKSFDISPVVRHVMARYKIEDATSSPTSPPSRGWLQTFMDFWLPPKV